jgi:hypothetical protein
MKEIRTEILIQTSAEYVWKVLTDFSSYEEWNPFIMTITGELKVGARFFIKIHFPGGREKRFRPVVLAVVPKKKLYWRGRLLFSKLFTGEHCFEIEELEPNLVRFIQYERHHSPLLPLVSRRIEFDAKRGFKEMNRALKIRAEKID